MTTTAAWQDANARYLAAALAGLRARLDTGPYSVRLRVDGVDSQLVNLPVTPPVFDPTQRVTIT